MDWRCILWYLAKARKTTQKWDCLDVLSILKLLTVSLGNLLLYFIHALTHDNNPLLTHTRPKHAGDQEVRRGTIIQNNYRSCLEIAVYPDRLHNEVIIMNRRWMRRPTRQEVAQARPRQVWGLALRGHVRLHIILLLSIISHVSSVSIYYYTQENLIT